jgi:PAS domain-containing protein
LSEATLNPVFREISRESLDADPAVCFVLDEKLRFVYCNPAWDRFAVQNGAPSLLGRNVLGTAILESTSGAVFPYYESLYGAAVTERRPAEHEFECSSAEVERLMKMNVYPLRSGPALLVVCSLRVERPHAGSAGEPLHDSYRDGRGTIVMCGNCRRTRRADVEPETWDWVADYVANPPERVSHGLCALCLHYYYGADV